MEVSSYHQTLRRMFPELANADPVEEYSNSSYNDGGTIYTTLWEAPSVMYRTSFNDWLIEHPYTSIQKVTRYLHTEWRVIELEKERRFGSQKN